MRTIDADALTAVLEGWEAEATDGTENDGSDGTTRIEFPVQTDTQEMIDLIADQPTVNNSKRQTWLEIALDIMQKIFSDLCHEHKHDEAEELLDIMRRVILLSNKLEEK